MPETSGQEKTEAPSPRRLKQAREEGNIARSTDLTAALMLLASIVLLFFFGQRLVESVMLMTRTVLTAEHAANPARADDLDGMLGYIGYVLGATLVPLLIATGAVGLIVAAMQVGLMLTGKPLAPQLSRINPLSGVKRLFDARAAMRLVMSLAKVGIIALIAIILIVMDTDKIIQLPAMELQDAFIEASMLTFWLALKLAGVLIVLAVLDYAFQKYQNTKDLRMTRQEVRQEMKDMDGDPTMKQRRMQVARQLAMQRMAQAVPQADVIITNPTHISIALKYDSASMASPKVIAKGADLMAMRVRQIATAHGIPLVERKPLARALYADVEVGQEIPEQYFAAVAEILAYVYRMAGKMSA